MPHFAGLQRSKRKCARPKTLAKITGRVQIARVVVVVAVVGAAAKAKDEAEASRAKARPNVAANAMVHALCARAHGTTRAIVLSIGTTAARARQGRKAKANGVDDILRRTWVTTMRQIGQMKIHVIIRQKCLVWIIGVQKSGIAL